MCVCVARMDLHVCEWIFSPEIKTYCQMSAPLPQDKAPGWDPHAPISSPRLPGLAVFPRRAGLHSFSPRLLPVPLQQWSSSHVIFDQSVRQEPSSPRAGHLHAQTWALRTGAQLSGALQGRKDYPFPSMPWHTQVCVCVCVCVCVQACVHCQCLAWSHAQNCGTDLILL